MTTGERTSERASERETPANGEGEEEAAAAAAFFNLIRLFPSPQSVSR